MKNFGKKAAGLALLAVLTTAIPLWAQSAAQWRQDIDILLGYLKSIIQNPGSGSQGMTS